MYLRMDDYHHRIALHPTGKDDVTYVGWGALNEMEFEDTKQRMLAGGLEYIQGTPEEIRTRMVADMVKFEVTGVPHELYYGLKVLAGKPFKPGRPMGGFKTGELGMGHIGFPLKDSKEINEAARIFHDVLGFKTSEWIGETPFFHINPRQHSVTFPPRAGFGNAKRSTAAQGKILGHFMLEVNSLDDVATCLDLCYERGIPSGGTLSKRITDNMIDFKMDSPSGFPIEYGWGGVLVDDRTWKVNSYDISNISMWGRRRDMLVVNTSKPEQVKRALKILNELTAK